MNRNQKLAKLVNAVREWRGVWDSSKKKWKIPANERAVYRVDRWLRELKVEDPDGCIALIQDFNEWAQFNEWVQRLDKPKPVVLQ